MRVTLFMPYGRFGNMSYYSVIMVAAMSGREGKGENLIDRALSDYFW